MTETPPMRVAAVVGLEGAFGRDLARGIRAFARPRRQWVMQFHRPSVETLRAMRRWDAEGYLAEMWDAPTAALARELGRPIVDLSHTDAGLPVVALDSTACAEVAAGYFVSRGYHSFAFVRITSAVYAVRREQAFVRILRERGHDCHVLSDRSDRDDLDAVEARLRGFLSSLPKPTAVLTDNDGRAVQVMEAARQVGVHVPEQLAVLGIDNDELLCELADPPLSSIAAPAARIGLEAAALLERLLAGEAAPAEPILLPPVGIVTRQSTDVLAIEDRDLAAAVRYIRENANRPLRTSDILRHVPVSRSRIERGFLAVLGRTVLEEIQSAHVERAKQLLAFTDLTMPEVAERSGFSSPRQFAMVFGRRVGQTPSGYRTQHRLRE